MADYQDDVVAWALEQTILLRTGNLSAIDVQHIADEIEDVAKRERRILAAQLSRLLSHLLQWQSHPASRTPRLKKSIKAERKEIEYALKEMPSLKEYLRDTNWLDVVWASALAQAATMTGVNYPDAGSSLIEGITLKLIASR